MWKCGQARRSSANAAISPSLDARRVDRAQAQPAEPLDPQELAHEVGEPSYFSPIGREVDPGDDDLGASARDEPPGLLDRRRNRLGTAGAAHLVRAAEGAAQVAAVLDLEKGAGPARIPFRPLLGEGNGLGRRRKASFAGERAGDELVHSPLPGVPAQEVGVAHAGEALGDGVGEAPDEDHLRVRMLAPQAADRLAGLLLGERGHRARADEVEVGLAARELELSREAAAHHLGLVLVDPAAEGEDLDARAFGRLGHLGVALHREPIEAYRLARMDPRLGAGDRELLGRRVHALEVGEQEAAAPTPLDNHAVALGVEILFLAGGRLREDVDRVDEQGELLLLDGRKAWVTGRGLDRV